MDPSKRNVWFITGCSKGFGLCLVKALLSAGGGSNYRVAATTRSIESLQKEITEGNYQNTESRFLPLSVDLTNEASIQSALQKTVDTFGRIDVLVNNAGFGLCGCMEEASTEDLHRLFDINVFSVHLVIKCILPFMRANNNGCILNIASIGAQTPRAGNGIYAATKAAVVAFTEALADEVSLFGIKACAVCPGPYRTNFQSSLQVVDTKLDVYQSIRDGVAQFMTAKWPGDPEKGVEVIIKVALLENLPKVFFLGEFSYERAKAKFEQMTQNVAEFKDLSLEA